MTSLSSISSSPTQNLWLPFLHASLTPSSLWSPQWRLRASSISGRHQDSSCAWHMFTKRSFLCFISSSSPSISPLSFQPTLLICSPLFHLEQVIPPVGYFYILHLMALVLFTSSSLKPHWNPIPSDNQRHLSQQPAATLRKVQTRWMTVKKSQGAAAEDDFL